MSVSLPMLLFGHLIDLSVCMSLSLSLSVWPLFWLFICLHIFAAIADFCCFVEAELIIEGNMIFIIEWTLVTCLGWYRPIERQHLYYWMNTCHLSWLAQANRKTASLLLNEHLSLALVGTGQSNDSIFIIEWTLVTCLGWNRPIGRQHLLLLQANSISAELAQTNCPEDSWNLIFSN